VDRRACTHAPKRRAGGLGDLYARYEHILAAAQLVTAMAGMGATLRIADFVEVVRVPRGILGGLATQLVAIPLLALLVGVLFELPAGLAVGLLIVAAAPGGTMSNVLTYFARGHVPLSISLTGVTTVASLVTAPLILELAAGGRLPGEVEMPAGRIAFEIAAFLLGPLATGMLVRAVAPERAAELFAAINIRATVTVILVLMVGAGTSERLDPTAHGLTPVVAIWIFTLLSLAIGIAVCTVLRLPPPERVAVGIEATFRNSSLAILIKAAAFPARPGVADPFGDAALFAILLYAGSAFIVAALPVVWHRRSARRAEQARTDATAGPS